MRDDAILQLNERRDPAPAGPAVQCLAGLLDGQQEDQPEALFELVAAVQPGVGPGDPVEFDALFVGEVLQAGFSTARNAHRSIRGHARCRPGRGIGRRPALGARFASVSRANLRASFHL